MNLISFSLLLSKSKHMIVKNQFHIYFFYDSEDNLLYIGKSNCFKMRMKQHFSKATIEKEPWKTEVDKNKIVLFRCENPTDLELYETYFINKYKPKYNVEKVYSYESSFDLPKLEAIKPMEISSILINCFNTKFNDLEKEVHSFRFSVWSNEDFCYYNKKTKLLELRVP